MTGEVRLQIHVQVLGDVAGEDEPRPADEEVLVVAHRAIAHDLRGRRARLDVHDVVPAELGVAAHCVLVVPLGLLFLLGHDGLGQLLGFGLGGIGKAV